MSRPDTPTDDTPLDLLVVGAGLAGVGAAAEYLKQFPDRRIAVLESRADIGGTWDLFRYPGARSDSDMLSYAYESRPWRSTQVLAGAGAIRDYLCETVREAGFDHQIHYGQRVRTAHWSSADQIWTVCTEVVGG